MIPTGLGAASYTGRMSETPLHQDRPITSSEDDRFDRSQYVRSLSEALLAVDGENLVVGITGPWGSGKTSVKNMLIESFRNADESRRPYIVEFDPWMFSGSDDLVALLFEEISASLRSLPARTRDKVVHALSKAAGIAAFVLKILELIPWTATNWGLSKLFGALSKALEGGPDAKPKALRKARTKLRKKLCKRKERDGRGIFHKRSNGPIIVFIDDLDRLTDQEISDMMRAVKAVGDLPGVVYVLLYDDEVVAKALGGSDEGKGRQYLEKIVQVPVGLPEIPIEKVHSDLYRQLREMTDARDRTDLFGYDDPILEQCVFPYITTSRRSNRLMNEMRIRYRVLGSQVETVDLAAITCLEIFDAETHRWIWEHKDLLVSQTRPMSVGLGARYHNAGLEARKKELKSAKDGLTENRRKAISALFPAAGAAWRMNVGYVQGGIPGQWICRSECFDAYFRVSPDMNVVPPSAFAAFVLDADLRTGTGIDPRVLGEERLPEMVSRYLSKAEKPEERAMELLRFCLGHYGMLSPSQGDPRWSNYFRMFRSLIFSDKGNNQRDFAAHLLSLCVRTNRPDDLPFGIYLAASLERAIDTDQDFTKPDRLWEGEAFVFNLIDVRQLIDRGLSRQQAECSLRELRKRILACSEAEGEYGFPLRYRDLCMLEAMSVDLFRDRDESIKVLRALRNFTTETEFAFSVPAVFVEPADEQGKLSVGIDAIKRLVDEETYRKAVEQCTSNQWDLYQYVVFGRSHAAYQAALDSADVSTSSMVVVDEDEAQKLYDRWGGIDG